MAQRQLLCRIKSPVIVQPAAETTVKWHRILGNSYIKFFLSNTSFHSFPRSSEGKLTKKVEKELPKLRKKLEIYSNGNQKGISAFIGYFLILNGVESTSLLLMDCVSIKNQQKNTGPMIISPKIQKYYDEKEFSKLEAKIGYKFRNRALFLQAFTMASHELSSCYGTYQRLEFLGDAVLEYLFARHLFNHSSEFAYPEIVQFFEKFKRNKTFASLSKKHGFQNYILYDPKTKIGKDTFANVFESLAAAIFIDSGMNLDEVWKVFHKLIYELKCFKVIESNEQICVK